MIEYPVLFLFCFVLFFFFCFVLFVFGQSVGSFHEVNLIFIYFSKDGIIIEQDLEDYEAEVESPLMVQVDDYTIYTPRTPSGGPVLSFIMNILDGKNIAPENYNLLL